MSFELDLPSLTEAQLPAAGGNDLLNLPAAGVGLPASTAGLPTVAAGLPSPGASLPMRAAGLPVAGSVLPTVAETLPNVAEVLPVAAEALPSPSRAFSELDLPVPTEDAAEAGASGDFGEIDLPRDPEASLSFPPPMAAPPAPTDGGFDGGFDAGSLDLSGGSAAPLGGARDLGEVQLESVPPEDSSFPPAVSAPPAAADGGLGFGEVDLGGGDAGASIPGETAPRPAAAFAGVASLTPPESAEPKSVSVAPPPPRIAREPEERRKTSPAKVVAAVLLTLGLLGGAALQLTPYGAFGYLTISDRIHAGAYAQATRDAIAQADKAGAPDTYEAAKAAAETVAAAHARMPRARQLTAYAAMVDAALTVRFGADASRASRAKQLLADLPTNEPVQYEDAATAAQAAASEDTERARKALDAAAKKDAGDPITLDEALLRGNLELAAHDGAQALAAFKQALGMADGTSPALPERGRNLGDARAHFGMARAYALMGDAPNENKELATTLASSPDHPGARTMRARLATGTAGEAPADKDMTALLAPASQGKLAPGELSAAYAAKAWLLASKGATSEAREAFAQSVKLDPRNIEALNGEGRLLLGESRYTEALARFDKALELDPSSPETIANDAEAKLDVERPADAKQQLVEAKARFPKSLPILLLLGRVERYLADKDAAEADLRAAIETVDPARSNAVLPYVALSELYAERGKVADAVATLHDAKKKLPASASLERAFGEVAEVEGDFEGALTHYHAALAIDANDAPTHFHLAGLLRRIRKFDEAGAELEKVAAVDKDYPGLSLERGLLYEQAGDVGKAIEQFKAALARAPEDPDLQLRVGEAYVAIGRADEALPMLHKVIDKRASSAEAHHYIGRALMLKTDSASATEALKYLKHAVELDPNRAEFHVYLAWAANEATPAQLELARDEVDKALAIDKLVAEAYWQRGAIEQMEGALDDAIKDERRALELRPTRYEAHATLAQCYENKNDFRTALAEWAKATTGDSKSVAAAGGQVPHPYWLYRYGKLLGEHNEAAAALAHLVPAATAAEKLDIRPGWLADLEFLVAEGLRKAGKKSEAADHYKRFLDIAPINSPDRADAKAALAKLVH
jgi:tetratricopeptide (TPR) repeat protein